MFGHSGVPGWLADRFGRLITIIAGGAFLIVASVLAPAVPTVAPLAIALILLGLGWNFCFVGGSSLLTDTLRANERNAAQGASDTFVSLASGLGNLSTGFIFNQWGIAAIGSVGLAFALIMLAAAAWKGKRPILAYENLETGD
jgi:MFS family permease